MSDFWFMPSSGSRSEHLQKKEGEHFFAGDKKSKPFFNSGIQAKLTIGSAGDPYEKEADAMADHAVQTDTMDHANEKGSAFSTNSGIASIQRACAACEEEKQLQGKEEDEKGIQKRSIFQKQDTPSVQSKCAACEEEEKIQRKPDQETSAGVNASIEKRLSAGNSGNAIPDGLRENMESSMGADFSGVKLHTDGHAAQMSKDLKAQAFTHKNDIYFNEGKYNPSSTEGKHLLAHELTHTVQQGSSVMKKDVPQIQKVPATEEQKEAIRQAIKRQGVVIEDLDIQAIHDQYPGGINAARQTVFVQVNGPNYSSISKLSAVRLGSLTPTVAQVELFVFQVGKGRAILVSATGGQSILLDAGAGGAVRSGSTAARVLATDINNVTMSGLAAAPTSIKLSHIDADHYNALSSVLNLPQMGNAVVEVTRQQLTQAMAQGNWATMNVQIAPNQRIVQLNVTGTGLDVRRSIIGNMEITEFRSEAAQTNLVTPGQNTFNKNNTSPVTIVRDLVSNSTYVMTGDAEGRLLNDVVNMVGEDAFRRLAGGGQRNLAAVEFPHHGGAVKAGPDATGMVRFLRLMFEASNGSVNFFAQTSQNFSSTPSAAIRYLDTADITVERVMENPTGGTGVKNIKGRENRTITLNGSQISSVVTLGNLNSSRVMEAYQMRDRILNTTEQLRTMEIAFSMSAGDAQRLSGALSNARAEVLTNETNLNASLGRFWAELANSAQGSGMRATSNTPQLQTEVTNLGTSVQTINITGIENSVAEIRNGISLMGRIFLNSLSMQQALRFRNLAELNQLKGEQRRLINELLPNARAELGKGEFHTQIQAAWKEAKAGWNRNYIQRVALRMGISEAESKQVLFRSVLALNLSRQMQLNELARRAQEGQLPSRPGSVTPMRTRLGAGFMAAIELMRIGLEFYDSYEAAEIAEAQRARENKIQGLREVYWWVNLGVRPEIKLLKSNFWGTKSALDISNEEAYRIVNEETPADQRPEYERVVVHNISDEDLQTVVAQFYLRYVTMEDWIEAMGNPDVNDRMTRGSSNIWFIKSGDKWTVKLWDLEDQEYKLDSKPVIQQPLEELMTHLRASQQTELTELTEAHAGKGTFTISDSAWVFGEDRNAFVYNSYGNPEEIDFDSFKPTFVKLDNTEFAYRIRGKMTLVRAANEETYRRLSRHYWVRETGTTYMDSSGTHRERVISANARGLAYVSSDSLIQKDAPTVQKKSNDVSSPAGSSVNIHHDLKSTNGEGVPLPSKTKTEMENGFGTDLSEVRIHTNDKAARMNKDLDAKAFTHGRDIYFDHGKYDPHSTQGKHLLAHELTHTFQQSADGSLIQRHPVAPTPVARQNRDAILGVAGVGGMNLTAFKQYTELQADWFAEPTLTATDRADLWKLLLKAQPGGAVLSGVGDVLVNQLTTVTDPQWPDLENYSRGCHSGSHTVRITASGPLADRITLGHTLGQVEVAIPGNVLEVTMSQAQLLTIQTDSLVTPLQTYWSTFHPHLQQTISSAGSMAAGTQSEVQLLLDFLRGPNITPFTSLLGRIRNLHRFAPDALTQIQSNFADFSRSKPVYLLLYSAHDTNAAFLKSRSLFENLMRDRTKLVLMLEGQATMQDIIDKVPDFARDYGQPDASGTNRIAQVMIAGHGGSRGLELAGSDAPTITNSGEVDYNSSRSENFDLDTNTARSEELLRRLIDNMDPATARIVYAGCLVGSTAVPARNSSNGIMSDADVSAHVSNPANRSLADVTRDMAAARGRPGMIVEGGRGSVGLSGSASLQDSSGNLHIDYTFDPAAFGTELEYLNRGREPEGVMRAAVQVAVNSSPIVAANQLRTRTPQPTPNWYDHVTSVFVNRALEGVAAGSGIDIAKVNQLANISEPLFLSFWASRSIASFASRVNIHGALASQLYGDVLGLSEMSTPTDFRTKQGRFIAEMGWAMLDPARAANVISYLDSRNDLTPGILERHIGGVNLSWLNTTSTSAQLFPTGASSTDGRTRLALAWIFIDNNNAEVRAYLDALVDTSGPRPRLQASVIAQLGNPADEDEVLRILGRLTMVVPPSSGSGPSLPAANADAFPNRGGVAMNDVRIEPNVYVATVIAPAHVLNVRTRPSMDGVPFHWLSFGDSVNVMGFVHSWAAVDINGRLGFAHRRFLSPPP